MTQLRGAAEAELLKFLAAICTSFCSPRLADPKPCSDSIPAFAPAAKSPWSTAPASSRHRYDLSASAAQRLDRIAGHRGAANRAAWRRADRHRQRHGQPRDRQARRRADQAGRRKESPNAQVNKIVVSEAGASVYSASAFAAAEFPELDVTLRGAVSIARRLQDPLAELVKIDPKAIGVGQYQHDVNQRALARALDATVEDCVNAVGVDVNTASVPLLARVSGLNSALAKNIVEFRDANGRVS